MPPSPRASIAVGTPRYTVVQIPALEAAEAGQVAPPPRGRRTIFDPLNHVVLDAFASGTMHHLLEVRDLLLALDSVDAEPLRPPAPPGPRAGVTRTRRRESASGTRRRRSSCRAAASPGSCSPSSSSSCSSYGSSGESPSRSPEASRRASPEGLPTLLRAAGQAGPKQSTPGSSFPSTTSRVAARLLACIAQVILSTRRKRVEDRLQRLIVDFMLAHRASGPQGTAMVPSEPHVAKHRRHGARASALVEAAEAGMLGVAPRRDQDMVIPKVHVTPKERMQYWSSFRAAPTLERYRPGGPWPPAGDGGTEVLQPSAGSPVRAPSPVRLRTQHRLPGRAQPKQSFETLRAASAALGRSASSPALAGGGGGGGGGLGGAGKERRKTRTVTMSTDDFGDIAREASPADVDWMPTSAGDFSPTVLQSVRDVFMSLDSVGLYSRRHGAVSSSPPSKARLPSINGASRMRYRLAAISTGALLRDGSAPGSLLALSASSASSSSASIAGCGSPGRCGRPRSAGLHSKLSAGIADGYYSLRREDSQVFSPLRGLRPNRFGSPVPSADDGLQESEPFDVHPLTAGSKVLLTALTPSAEATYFLECDREGVLPKMPRFLLQGADGCVDLSDSCLTDAAFVTMVPALAALSPPARKLTLRGNAIGDVGLRCLYSALGQANVFRALKELDLSDTRPSAECLKEFAGLLHYPLRTLESLALSRVPVPDSAWGPLADGLTKLSYLRRLALADVGLGRHLQRPCVNVCSVLEAAPSLAVVDLSNNFFEAEGFVAMAKALSNSDIQDLDLSSNTAGLVTLRDADSYAPILLLLSSLADARALKHLRLQNCLLDYTADFVLMASVPQRSSLESMDLSHNPHGQNGIQCLLRLVTERWPPLFVRVVAASAGSPCIGAVPVNRRDFTGRYQLQMRHPQHRAVLQVLLEEFSRRGAGDTGALQCLAEFTYNGHAASPAALVKCHPASTGAGRWRPPLTGVVRFNIAVGTAQQHFWRSWPDERALLRAWARTAKRPLPLTRFAITLAMYRELQRQEPQRLFLQALAEECVLKVAQVQEFLRESSMLDRSFVVQSLYAAIEHEDKVGMFNVMLIARSCEDVRQIVRETNRFVFFNPCAPNGTYHLDLRNACERAVTADLLVINAWHREQAQVLKLPDLSQHGDFESLRNVRAGGLPLNGGADVSQLLGAATPDVGLDLDYTAPPINTPTEPLNVIIVERLMAILRNSPCTVPQRIHCMRLVTHRLAFTTVQVREVLSSLLPLKDNKRLQKARHRLSQVILGYIRRGGGDAEARRRDAVIANRAPAGGQAPQAEPNGNLLELPRPFADRRRESRARMLLENVLNAFDIEAPSLPTITSFQMPPTPAAKEKDKEEESDYEGLQQLLGVWGKPSTTGLRLPHQNVQTKSQEELMAARLELLQLLYARTIDLHNFTSPELLFHPSAVDFREAVALKARLGAMRLFDIMRCHVPTTGKNFVAPSPSQTSGEGGGKTTANLHGNLFVFDLSVHEDWRLVRLVLRLLQQEINYGCHALDCLYVEKNDPALLDKATEFGIWHPPETWIKDTPGPPHEGYFTMRYISTKGMELSPSQAALRWRLAHEYLGWRPPATLLS